MPMMLPNLAPARNRRGAALPVALMGLVAVSLLVTAALFTSSTEFAISAAHRTGAASLFDADAALEQYVADRMAAGPGMVATAAGAVRGPGGAAYTVQVDQMSDVRDTSTDPMKRTEIFSLVVQPQNGRGRGVGAFVKTERRADKLDLNLNAGTVSAGDVRVTGNATISDGRTGTNYCGTADNQADYSVQVTAGSTIDARGTNLEGVGDTTSYGKEALARNLMGDSLTLTELADAAGIKFGARWDSAAFQTTPINSDPSTPLKYNWGCPRALGTTCPSAAAAARHVVVAIDAQVSGGGDGVVKLNGHYGQGMIIILNGDLEIAGNFTFKGVIMVEKDVRMLGGSRAGEESKVEGSIIAFGAGSEVRDNYSGSATVKYNFCSIQDAEEAMNGSALENARQNRSKGTFSWYELIR